MTRTLLFVFFITLTITGGFLTWKRTGNYDVDYFTKIIGWMLLIPGIIGILESLYIIK